MVGGWPDASPTGPYLEPTAGIHQVDMGLFANTPRFRVRRAESDLR